MKVQTRRSDPAMSTYSTNPILHRQKISRRDLFRIHRRQSDGYAIVYGFGNDLHGFLADKSEVTARERLHTQPNSYLTLRDRARADSRDFEPRLSQSPLMLGRDPHPSTQSTQCSSGVGNKKRGCGASNKIQQGSCLLVALVEPATWV